ncbi:MAG TPA: hypothetical protein RMH99_05175, partial [Sandaracinaceae bacterium LLY-WYZ-13_1]|nr:hypothetical protein [Sandaracinaceae bacterium LLY-WYZ-13_1]
AARADAPPRTSEPAPEPAADEGAADASDGGAEAPDAAVDPARVAEARSRPSPPVEFFLTSQNASVMWAELARLRVAAGDQVAAAAERSLREWHAELGGFLEHEALAPEGVARFVIASRGWTDRWVATLVYADPRADRLAAHYPADGDTSLADGRSVRVFRLGPELGAVQLSPTRVVVGTHQDLREALARPPQPTSAELGAPGRLFSWSLAEARRFLSTRPRRANPNDLRMDLVLEADGAYAVDATGVFESPERAAEAQTHWRQLLAQLGDNAFLRALRLDTAFRHASVGRPRPEVLAIGLRLDAGQLASLAQLFASTTAL